MQRQRRIVREPVHLMRAIAEAFGLPYFAQDFQLLVHRPTMAPTIASIRPTLTPDLLAARPPPQEYPAFGVVVWQAVTGSSVEQQATDHRAQPANRRTSPLVFD